MAAYVAAGDAVREAFNCVVVVVHHCGIDASRPRGHTGLTGAVDAQLAVRRDQANNVVVTVEWQKDGPEGDMILSRLEPVDVGADSDGEAITSCVVLPTSGEPQGTLKSLRPTRMPKAAQIALKALCEAVGECGGTPPASDHIPTTVRVVTVEQWRTYAYLRGISTSEEPRARQLAFKRASEHLVGASLVGIWDGQAWPTA